jgi:hypothetical protein
VWWSTVSTDIACMDTAAPERKVLNNETQATIFVGRKLYLPVITKAY